MIGCELVAIGADDGRRNRSRLLGISSQATFDRQAELFQSIEAVMSEALLRSSLADGCSADQEQMQKTTAWQQVKSLSRAGFVDCFPLPHASSRFRVALLILAKDDPLGDGVERERFLSLLRFISSLVELCAESQPSRWRRVGQRLAGQRGVLRKPLVWAAATAIAGALAIPLPYQVRCDCQVQPIERRYVSAPYEGRLQEAFASPGDAVGQGEVLAVMDDREIKWELGTLQAELHQAEKERVAATAAHETARAQVAQYEVDRLRLKIELLRGRLEHLEIKSPLQGIAIGGNPQELVGARLTMGQTLLEIAPLDRMMVDVEIHDEDIAHVEPGQSVKFRLDSQPFRQCRGEVLRIHPRAEQRDGENVYIAEVQIEDSDEVPEIRPGMEGTAKIATARHTVAWNLFHKAWYALLYRMGW